MSPCCDGGLNGVIFGNVTGPKYPNTAFVSVSVGEPVSTAWSICFIFGQNIHDSRYLVRTTIPSKGFGARKLNYYVFRSPGSHSPT